MSRNNIIRLVFGSGCGNGLYSCCCYMLNCTVKAQAQGNNIRIIKKIQKNGGSLKYEWMDGIWEFGRHRNRAERMNKNKGF